MGGTGAGWPPRRRSNPIVRISAGLFDWDDPDVAEALAGLWVVSDRSDGSPLVEPELRLLARGATCCRSRALTTALGRRADLPIAVAD
jgi:hypothetical protein